MSLTARFSKNKSQKHSVPHMLYTHILKRTHVRTQSVILCEILHIWLSLGFAGESPGPQPCHNPCPGPRQYRHSPQRAESSGFLGVKPTHGPQLDYKALIFTWKTQKPSYRQFFSFAPQGYKNLEMGSSRERIWPSRASPGAGGWRSIPHAAQTPPKFSGLHVFTCAAGAGPDREHSMLDPGVSEATSSHYEMTRPPETPHSMRGDLLPEAHQPPPRTTGFPFIGTQGVQGTKGCSVTSHPPPPQPPVSLQGDNHSCHLVGP